MNTEQLIVTLIIGAVAGWLAGQLTGGGGLALLKTSFSESSGPLLVAGFSVYWE